MSAAPNSNSYHAFQAVAANASRLSRGTAKPGLASASERIGIVQTFLERLRCEPGDSIADLIHPDFQQIDLPSPTSPNNTRRNAAQLLADWRASSAWLQWQNIHVVSLIEVGNRVVARIKWEGMTPSGIDGRRRGTLLTSDLGIVFDFLDGKIISQRNYDWQRFRSSLSQLSASNRE